jgi:3-hydroxyisobutyrate dehydrogenase
MASASTEMAPAPALVGFVGLGNMGWPMARSLRRAGVPLVVHDAAVDVARRFRTEHGGTVAAAPADFAGCDVVVTMLPDDSIVREVVLDWEGGIASRLARGAVVLDMSSSSPTGIRALAEGAAAFGVEVVDAPVSGGVTRAETGELSLMVGGEDANVEKVASLLDVLGARTFRTGALGSGDAVKALNNFLAAAGYAAAAEAMRIGERLGVDPATLFDVVNTSTGRSFVTDVVISGNVITGAYSTGFQLALLAKDVGIAAGLAEDLGMDTPVLSLVDERWRQAAADAPAGADHSAAHLQWWSRPAAQASA